MSNPALEIQGALVAALKAATAVTALVGQRIYDRAPQGVSFPYVELGEIQTVDDGAECLEDGAEVYITLHVWSRAVGLPECHAINAAIKATVHAAPLTLGDDLDCVDILCRDIRAFADADGITSHGVLTLRALVDPIL